MYLPYAGTEASHLVVCAPKFCKPSSHSIYMVRASRPEQGQPLHEKLASHWDSGWIPPADFARINTNYLHKSNFDMLVATLKGIADRFELLGEPLGEVAAGAVVKHTRDSNLTRDAVIAAGLNPQTPGYDVQQACATSLETAILVGNKIATGQIDIGIAGGVDSASDVPVVVNESFREMILGLQQARSRAERIKWTVSFSNANAQTGSA